MKVKLTRDLLLLCFLLLGLGACDRFGRNPLDQAYFASEPASGVTVIHVSEKGSDTATGTVQDPLASLGAALKLVKPGEATLIRMAPGIYRERVLITNAENLTIEGARNGHGHWLSVIDGSQALDPRQWQKRPEVGPGVYAYPMPDARLVLVDQKSVARIDQRALVRRLEGEDDRPKTMSEVLLWPDDATVSYRGKSLLFWDTLGGLFTPSPAGDELWLRLRNGMNPADHQVSIAPDGATVDLRQAKGVALQNLLIRGGRHGVNIIGGSGNRVEHCYIPHGGRRIHIGERAADTVIANNRLEMGFYGQPTGAWGMSEVPEAPPLPEEATRKGFVYHFFKFWAGPRQVSDDVGISVEGSGETLIRGNFIDGGLIGISLRSNARVEGNVVRQMSSVGTVANSEVTQATYDGNLFSDCNISFRFGSLNVETPPRSITILRNISLLPEGRGTHLFCHYMYTTPRTPEHEIAVYHNTFLGGHRGLALPPAENRDQALRSFKIINNRFIGCEILINAPRSVKSQPGMFGLFDYNQISARNLALHTPTVWLGKHNFIEKGDPEWRWDSLTHTPPSIDNAAGLGINLSQPYEIDGKAYPALSKLSPDYFTGERPTPGAPEIDLPDLLPYDHD